ncbi:arad-like aldolase/epimerase [Pleomassaria siparia CBS 279.74]|uniref:Arad-like aldolase/epimerase n=1 Tax=Pleomassaria siparia CBS 279.74 TaxID=1314801 RepID=A0A6G1K0N8_9PLEO|nr:arad-like aldolase/epimerase [Pleomassaria siparia CBS 279.74]
MPISYTQSRVGKSDVGKTSPDLRQVVRLLISANHILHQHGLVDAFGHISARHPLFDDQYIIASYDPGAPALVSSVKDFIEYYTSNSEPVQKDQPRGYSERFIHGEIYARYPAVKCVVHSHSESVIPFMAAGFQIKPVFHMAGFLGAAGPPVFDLTDLYTRMNRPAQDMLIKNSFLGKELAETFFRAKDSGIAVHPVVLQNKHGFTCIGSNIQQAVYRAIYLQNNCKLLKDALDLAGGDVTMIQFLTKDEAEGCEKMNWMTQDKAFRLWLREVQVNPLYQNEEGAPEELPVGGMQDDSWGT